MKSTNLPADRLTLRRQGRVFVGYTFLERRITLSGSVGSTVRVTVSWAVIADMACPVTEENVQLSTEDQQLNRIKQRF